MKEFLVLLILLALFLPVFGQEYPPLQEDIYKARDKILPALVHIQPVITDYRTGKLRKQSVIGSGVIYSEDGYVVTNYHVAGKAERIICTLFDKEQVKADLIGGDPLTDLAVIKLDLSEYNGTIVKADFGNSDAVQVGQYVLAMGSPLALARSVSAGVISTTDRYFSGEARLPSGEKTGLYNNWIQTDAAINPGNSGGPLVDLQGRIVGINSRAIMFANNIAFSIPSNIVREVIEEILGKGEVVRSWIGVQSQELQDLEGWFGTERNTGVLVASVDPKSPAEEAGIQAGDILLQMDGETVSARFAEELPKFYKRIADKEVGSTVEFTVLRGTDTIYVDVITHELGEILGEDLEVREWGFTVKAITKQMVVDNQLEDTLGVFVSGVKRVGPAAEAGLRRADVIKAVNEEEITSFGDFYNKYNELVEENGEKVLLTVSRFGSTRYILIKIDNKQDADKENE